MNKSFSVAAAAALLSSGLVLGTSLTSSAGEYPDNPLTLSAPNIVGAGEEFTATAAFVGGEQGTFVFEYEGQQETDSGTEGSADFVAPEVEEPTVTTVNAAGVALGAQSSALGRSGESLVAAPLGAVAAGPEVGDFTAQEDVCVVPQGSDEVCPGFGDDEGGAGSGSDNNAGASGDSAALPDTGANDSLIPLALAGGVLLALGGGAVVVTRRRRGGIA